MHSGMLTHGSSSSILNVDAPLTPAPQGLNPKPSHALPHQLRGAFGLKSAGAGALPSGLGVLPSGAASLEHYQRSLDDMEAFAQGLTKLGRQAKSYEDATKREP